MVRDLICGAGGGVAAGAAALPQALCLETSRRAEGKGSSDRVDRNLREQGERAGRNRIIGWGRGQGDRGPVVGDPQGDEERFHAQGPPEPDRPVQRTGGHPLSGGDPMAAPDNGGAAGKGLHPGQGRGRVRVPGGVGVGDGEGEGLSGTWRRKHEPRELSGRNRLPAEDRRMGHRDGAGPVLGRDGHVRRVRTTGRGICG